MRNRATAILESGIAATPLSSQNRLQTIRTGTEQKRKHNKPPLFQENTLFHTKLITMAARVH